MCAVLCDTPSAFLSSTGGDDSHPGRASKLDGRSAYTTGGAVYKHGLAGSGSGAVKKSAIGRRVWDSDARALLEGQM